MSRRRARHPLISFSLFLIVCSMGWVAWEYRDELRSKEAPPPLASELRERVEDVILSEFDSDDCFLDISGGLNWRPSERRYRLDILLDNSSTCEERAQGICTRIAERIRADTDLVATVVAFDSAGRELARCVL